MALDQAAVTRIAGLARIRLSDEETAALAGELSRILDFVAELEAVDTEGVTPMSSVVGASLTLRADAVTDGDCRDAVLANAPEAAAGFFVVPKVVE